VCVRKASSITESRLETRELLSASAIQDAQRLRHTVWECEGAVLYDSQQQTIADPHDDHAIHWGVFEDDVLIGTARLCLHDSLAEAPDGEMFAEIDLPIPIASMNRLVVLKSHRGLGIGRLLDDLRIAKARQLGARAVIVTPANVESRLRSLERRGFRFLAGILGHPIWSPSVTSCACCLILNEGSPDTDV
jgi:GNAT superfamily N-acetyltransferase